MSDTDHSILIRNRVVERLIYELLGRANNAITWSKLCTITMYSIYAFRYFFKVDWRTFEILLKA